MVSSMLKPCVGAHVGIYDPGPAPSPSGEKEAHPPAMFEQIRFDAVDVLHDGHFINTKDGHFSIGTPKEDVPHPVSLPHRFEHIVKTDRWWKKDIIIIAEQMYSPGEGFDNLEIGDAMKTAAMVNTYTDSVRDFLQTWAAKPEITHKGKTTSPCINSYDIDHEGSVETPCAGVILRRVRAKADELSEHDSKSRRFFVGTSPYPTRYLDKSMADSCDFVHMQRYSGGDGTSPDAYRAAIEALDPTKLTLGIEIETPWRNAASNNTIGLIAKAAFTVAKGNPVAGIWTRRLGSDRAKYKSESLVQVRL